MRILILGNNYGADKFFDLFEQNPENIVFSNLKDKKNYIDFIDNDDILEFCSANALDLVLVTENDYINAGLSEQINAAGISAFSPSVDAIGICSSKSYAKRFMHKNKIPTVKFGVFEKSQPAADYLKQCRYPQVIKPDVHTYRECSKFVETKSKAFRALDELFVSGNAKILIEDYIEGKNLTVWTISDGYSAKIIGSCAKYSDSVSYFEPGFLTDELKNEINNNIIIPTIDALSRQDSEYTGILGFDVTVTFEGKPYLTGYKSFFDDMSTDFFINGYDLDWAGVFESCLVGDIFLKYDFTPSTKNMLILRQNEQIEFVKSSTRSNLENFALECGLDLTEYLEAKKVWKYYR